MDEYESLSHSKWECKYHVMFIPKGRRRRCMGTEEVFGRRCSASWQSKRKAGSRKSAVRDAVTVSIAPGHDR